MNAGKSDLAPSQETDLAGIFRPTSTDVTALILAGGRGERMGGQDKGLIEVNGKAVIDEILAQITPHVGSVLINANRHLEQYEQRYHKVIEDTMTGFQGPLAGLLTGLREASTAFVLTLPCDAPRLPEKLVERMCMSLPSPDSIAVAHDGERLQPVYALVPVSLADDLQQFLESGQRKIRVWYQQHGMTKVDFSDQPTAFHNINTPADKARLEQP